MNTASLNRLTKVHPELAKRVAFLAQELANQGHTVEVVQGLRTFAEQDALFAQGRTKPGQVVTRAGGGQSKGIIKQLFGRTLFLTSTSACRAVKFHRSFR